MSESEIIWSDVDAYAGGLMIGADRILDAALKSSADAGLPAINVSPCQGKFLSLFAQAMGARRILEIGTLGGYSAIWLARALPPNGKLVTLEYDAKHARVARANIERAGFAGIVDVLQGDAHVALATMIADGVAPFDFVFIDAEKSGYPDYLEKVLKLTRPGSLIVADNVVREGAVLKPAGNADLQGLRRYLERVAAAPQLDATVLQTVGSKGHDGFAIARVLAAV